MTSSLCKCTAFVFQSQVQNDARVTSSNFNAKHSSTTVRQVKINKAGPSAFFALINWPGFILFHYFKNKEPNGP